MLCLISEYNDIFITSNFIVRKEYGASGPGLIYFALHCNISVILSIDYFNEQTATQ